MKIKGRTFVVSGGYSPPTPVPLPPLTPFCSASADFPSASGLGRATVNMLLENGANAAILDLNADLGTQAASDLGPSARFFQCDVTSSESIARAVEGTMAWVAESGKPLGGIVPAAGIATPGTVSSALSASLGPTGRGAVVGRCKARNHG